MKLAVLVIDVQKEYFEGGALVIENIEKSLSNIKTIIDASRRTNVELIHVKHVESSADAEDFAPNTVGIEFIDGFEPADGEKLIEKNFPGSFYNTDLKKYLDSKGIDSVAIVGYSSFLCCDTTSREAFHLGYKVFYVEDAIGEFKIGPYSEEELHEYAKVVQSESGFADVISTQDLINRFLNN